MKTEIQTSSTQVEPSVTPSKELIIAALIRLFKSLENAAQDTETAYQLVVKIAEGIEANPEFSQQVLTPENIEKVTALKAKSDAGTIKLTDIEEAFPMIAKKVPFWSLIKTFKF